MNINSENKYKLIYLSLFGLFAAIACSLYFLKGIVANVKETKLKTAEINRDIALLDKINQEKTQYADDIQKVKGTLPSQYFEFSFFTSELERIAGENNLTLETEIAEKQQNDKTSYASVPFSLTVKGTYPAMSQFLSAVSKLPYHTMVEKMQIAKEEGVLTGNITFQLFVEK